VAPAGSGSAPASVAVNEAATPSDKVNIQRLDLANFLPMAYFSKQKRPRNGNVVISRYLYVSSFCKLEFRQNAAARRYN
jgi:hypothetical protein